MLLLVVSLLACETQTPSQNPPEILNISDETRSGRTIYRNVCQCCHGLNADGNSASSAALGEKPLDSLSYTDEQIKTILQNGKGLMPSTGLSEEEQIQVISYLRSIQKKE